ncbi:MAG: Holliday junction resolvase RecU [Bacilli bacterium]|nr:Holliday junction resolvase RecU [Bacilli bacterium]
MTIRYPKGIAPRAEGELTKKSKRKVKAKIASGNRGMAFEADINNSNQYYRDHDLAVITKRPTPINIVKVDYSKGATITQAYFETQSTTDYNGVYKGRYIDFEAKSTHGSTAFPLSNIPHQQIEHLERVIAHGGIAFFLIQCVAIEETYLVPASYIVSFYRERPRQSIPFTALKENGYLVKEGYSPRYDYLPLVEEVFLK